MTANGRLLFSKLSSTYFPHTLSITEKIISFVNDLRSGKDVSSYDINSEESLKNKEVARWHSPGKSPNHMGNHSLKESIDKRNMGSSGGVKLSNSGVKMGEPNYVDVHKESVGKEK